MLQGHHTESNIAHLLLRMFPGPYCIIAGNAGDVILRRFASQILMEAGRCRQQGREKRTLDHTSAVRAGVSRYVSHKC